MNTNIVYRTTEPCTDCETVDCEGKDKCRKECKGKPPYGENCDTCNDYSKHYKTCEDCTMFDCYGIECGLSHCDGYFMHCVSCSDMINHANIPVEMPEKKYEKLIIINCKDKTCRVHHRHRGRGIVHCICCYPEDDQTRWYVCWTVPKSDNLKNE